MSDTNMVEEVKAASDFLKLMSNEVRLLILCCLMEDKLTVGELNEKVGVSQSSLSQHLAKLREDNVVETQRDGLNIYYSVSKPIVGNILKILHEEFCPNK